MKWSVNEKKVNVLYVSETWIPGMAQKNVNGFRSSLLEKNVERLNDQLPNKSKCVKKSGRGMKFM